MSVDKSATRRRTVVTCPDVFEGSVVIPGVLSAMPPKDELTMDMPKTENPAVFCDAEVATLLAAYRLCRTDVSDNDVRILYGLNSVDTGPDTRINSTSRLQNSKGRFQFSTPPLPLFI